MRYTQEIGRIPADPYLAARHRPDRLVGGPERVAGQERDQVLAHADRSDPRAATAVWDAERLVQIEVADVGSEPAGFGEPDQGVQVGTVDVYLATRIVDHRGQVPDPSSNTPCVEG